MTTILMYGIVTTPMIEWIVRNPDGVTVDIRKSEPIRIEQLNGSAYHIQGPTNPSFIKFKNESTALMFQLTFSEHLIGQQYDYEETLY
jgi:hypothetical protein